MPAPITITPAQIYARISDHEKTELANLDHPMIARFRLDLAILPSFTIGDPALNDPLDVLVERGKMDAPTRAAILSFLG